MTVLIDNTPKGPKKYRYSEIFGHTFQGEGEYCGVPTVWVRFWGCNFNCNGFGQKDPTNPSTWELPFQDVDVTKYASMEELPVFHTGCDSSYSWAKKFSHLAGHSTVAEISSKVREYLQGGRFEHPRSKQWTHMALTGGEPMMSQTAIVELLSHMRNVDRDLPRFVTIETNGTQLPREAFTEFFSDYGDSSFNCRPVGQDDQGRECYKIDTELFWSVSPKLYLSGEPWEKAIRPEVLRAYNGISDRGQLKYVCNGTQRNWDEVERATDLFRNEGIDWPVWIMPVGADREMQESHQAAIAEEACKRGYNVAARVHTWVFGNVIGK